MAVWPPQEHSNVWQLMPAEIRIEIYKNLADLPTLRNLLVASPSDQSLFRRYASEVLEGPLNNLSDEGGEHVNSMKGASLRTANAVSLVVASDLEKHVKANGWPPLETYSCSDEVAWLFHVTEAMESIDCFVTSFAYRRVLVPSGQPDSQVSSRELCRIRCAFLRFQSIYEQKSIENVMTFRGNFHERTHFPGRLATSKRRAQNDPGNDWLCRSEDRSQTSCWYYLRYDDRELYEWEAVRGFLRDEVNSFQLDQGSHQGILEKQPLLIQRLVRDLEYWPRWGIASSHNKLVVDTGVDWCWGWPGRLEMRLIHYQQSLFQKREHWGWAL